MSDISDFASWEEENRSLESDEKSQQEQRRMESSQANGEMDSSSDERSEGDSEFSTHELFSEEARGRTLQPENGQPRSWREVTREASNGSLGFGTQEVFQEINGRAKRGMSVGYHSEEDDLAGGIALAGTLNNRIPGDVVSEGGWSLACEPSEDEEHPDFVAPPSSQPRPQSEFYDMDVDEQSNMVDLPHLEREHLATISDALEEFDFPEDGEDIAWTFAQAPPEEIENLRRVSIGLTPKELAVDRNMEPIGLYESDLHYAFDFSRVAAENALSSLVMASIEEIEKLRKALTGSPSKGLEWPKPMTNAKTMSESMDEFVQQHKLLLQANVLSSERHQAKFEKDVYRFARKTGMGCHRAKVEVWKARAAFKRKLGMGNGTTLDVDYSEEEVVDIPPLPIFLRRAVDVYPNYDPETSYSNMTQIAADPNPTGKGKRKMVDMPEEERNEIIAKRQKKADKKARRVAVAETKQTNKAANWTKLTSKLSVEEENSSSSNEDLLPSTPKTLVKPFDKPATEDSSYPECQNKEKKSEQPKACLETSTHFPDSPLPPSTPTDLSIGNTKLGPKPANMTSIAWRHYRKRLAKKLSNSGTTEQNSMLPTKVSQVVAQQPPLKAKNKKKMNKIKQEKKVKQPKPSDQQLKQNTHSLNRIVSNTPVTSRQHVSRLDGIVPDISIAETESAKPKKKNRKKKRNNNRLPISGYQIKHDQSSSGAGNVPDITNTPQTLSRTQPQCIASDKTQPRATHSTSIDSKGNLDSVFDLTSTLTKEGETSTGKSDGATNEVSRALSELHGGNSTKTRLVPHDQGREDRKQKPLNIEGSLKLGGQSLDSSGKAFHS